MLANPAGCLAAHRIGDGGTHVAALRDVAGVAEALHQLGPRSRDAAGVPADLGRLAGEAVAGDRRQHEVERVLGASTVRGRVGERAHGLEQLDDRAGPAVRHDQRQRVGMRRADVDEVDIHPVDLGRELRQRVEFGLHLAPVVVGCPVADEFLNRRQLHTLRPICDQLLVGPAVRGDTAAQVGERLVGHVDVERMDIGMGHAGWWGHIGFWGQARLGHTGLLLDCLLCAGTGAYRECSPLVRPGDRASR